MTPQSSACSSASPSLHATILYTPPLLALCSVCLSRSAARSRQPVMAKIWAGTRPTTSVHDAHPHQLGLAAAPTAHHRGPRMRCARGALLRLNSARLHPHTSAHPLPHHQPRNFHHAMPTPPHTTCAHRRREGESASEFRGGARTHHSPAILTQTPTMCAVSMQSHRMAQPE